MPVKIKHIAKAYGITRKGIHYYADRGIISPLKDDANNYMLLSVEDIYSIFRCKAYQKYGFSVDEVAKIGTQYTLENMKSMLLKKLAVLEREIQDKQISASVLSKQLEGIDRVNDNYNRCIVQKGVGVYYFSFLQIGAQDSPYSMYLKHDNLELVSEWIEYVPSAASFKQYHNFLPNAKVQDNSMMEIGLCIWEDYADIYPIKDDVRISYIPPQDCVLTIVKGPYNTNRLEQRFLHVVDYFERNGLELTAPPYSTMISSVHEDGINQQYEHAWFPFRKILQ